MMSATGGEAAISTRKHPRLGLLHLMWATALRSPDQSYRLIHPYCQNRSTSPVRRRSLQCAPFTHAFRRFLAILHNLTMLLLIAGVEPNPGPTNIKLTVCHTNINSITANGRLDELSQFVHINDIDILCLSETKLDKNVHPSMYHLPGYSEPLTRHRTRHGGGVAIYTRSNLAVHRLSDFESTDIEWIWARVKIGPNTVIVCCTYVPPNPTAQQQFDFSDQLRENVLKAYAFNASCIVILGDLNSGNIFLDDITVTHSGISGFDRVLFDTYAEIDLQQIIREPTRMSSSCSNLRDQIIVSNMQYVLNSGTLSPFSNIDHMPVYVTLDIETTQSKASSSRVVWDYARMNPVLFTELLIGTKWDDILDQDLDSATDDFTHTLLNAASKAIPKREITVRNTDKSWVTGELRRCIRKRERLFRRAKRTDCSNDWDKWRRQRSVTSDLNKRLKRSYLIKQSHQLTSQKQNPRKYHAILKQMIGKRKISQIPPLEVADGELVTEDKDKAELLNDHFAKQSTSARLTSLPSPTGQNVPQ